MTNFYDDDDDDDGDDDDESGDECMPIKCYNI